MDKEASKKVKVGSVSFTVYPWKHRSGKTHWRFAWHDLDGKRKFTTRAEFVDAKRAARDRARMIHNQTFDLSTISEEEARICRAFLDLKPDWPLIERLKEERKRGSLTVREALKLFLDMQEANAGDSPHNVYTLTKRTKHFLEVFGGRNLAELTVSDLDKWLVEKGGAASTRKGIASSISTFFRWARKQSYLPDQTTEAEKMAIPIVMKKAPATYTADELRIMLAAVREEYLPWLALSSWASIRREELYPATKSKKDALQWEDINFKRKIIVIRREVSKTNERRVIPICGALLAILEPFEGKKGRVTGKTSPSDQKNKKLDSETKRLGALVGGWKPNALRHSSISNRCAIIGVGKAAMEAGNSESETRRDYLDAVSEEEARDYFQMD